MKKIIPVLALALSLTGCAQINSARDWLNDPKTQAAAQMLACSIRNASVVAAEIADAVNAGQAAVDTTGKVYTVSAIVCKSLGGVVTGKTATGG